MYYLQTHRESFANISENMNEKEHHLYLQNRRDSFRNGININAFQALSVLFTRSYREISTGPASFNISINVGSSLMFYFSLIIVSEML